MDIKLPVFPNVHIRLCLIIITKTKGGCCVMRIQFKHFQFLKRLTEKCEVDINQDAEVKKDTQISAEKCFG